MTRLDASPTLSAHPRQARTRRGLHLAGALSVAMILSACAPTVDDATPATSSSAGSASADSPAVAASSTASADPSAGATAELTRTALYPCTGYGQLRRYNTLESNAEDVYGWRPFEPVAVGDGSGDIDWDADPYADAGWRLWLSSLRWIGPSIDAGRDGDDAAFSVAERVIRDWAADHTGGWGDDPDDAEANHHRLNVLLCFREAVVTREGGTLPEEYAWVDRLIEAHVEQNKARYSARHNHGSMENKALLGAGCVLDRPEWRRHALDRVAADLPHQVDAQGVSIEFAPHYARFNYDLFRQLEELARTCGESPGSLDATVQAMGRVLPHMVDSTGHYWQYGDSAEYPLKPTEGESPEMRWSSSNGAEGTAPTQRTAGYAAGLVFGRSSWGTREAGFADAASWMLRAGTGQEKKAHPGDVLQFLYTARGRQIVEDGGHPGIVTDDWRPWGLGPTAHNVIHVPTLAGDAIGTGAAVVDWTEESTDGRADGAAASQPLGAGGERARAVLVLTAPDAAVVVDRTRITDGRTDHRIESLWNLPAEFAAERTAPDTVRAVDAAAGEATTLVQIPLDGAEVAPDGVELYRGVRDPAPGGHAHRGFHYPQEQEREESTQVAFGTDGAQAGVVSVLIPAGAADEVGVETERAADGTLTLTITGAHGEARVSVGQDGRISRLP